MKINLIFFLARFGKGGAGNSVFRLCKSLNKKKYNIFVICLNKCAYEKELVKNKIKVIKISASRVLFSIFKLRKYLSQITEKFDKNILISNINYTNLLCAIFIRKNYNLKLIGIERTPLKELEIYFSLIDRFKKTLIRILIRFFYKKFDLIICNSRYMSKYLKIKYKISSITIFPPSLEKININKKRSTQKNIYLKLKIITVCRLSREKNLFEIIKAIKDIKSTQIILRIIGDGQLKNNLKNYLKKINTSNKIKLLGYKANPYKYLIKSDLYINSSYFEGFPNSVVEAINANLPIISSQSHGGINDILLNGKAGTIYKNNAKDLKNKILDFINNNQKYQKKTKLAKFNLKNFTLNKHVKKFENEIKKIYKL